MANKIRTSKRVAGKASSQLRSKATTKNTKSVAGSALTNRKKWGIDEKRPFVDDSTSN